MIKKWCSSLNARMIFVLLAALAVGVVCYFGIDALGRMLVVIYTIRGERIRIISARPATRNERAAYEKQGL